jgi:hypothetical protein
MHICCSTCVDDGTKTKSHVLMSSPLLSRQHCSAVMLRCNHAHAVLLPTGEVSTSRDGNKKLLEQYSAAVRLREVHDMRAAISSSMAALGLETQRLAAVRIMAGLTDPRVAALHDVTNKLVESAAASRWATVAAMASTLGF